MLAVLVLFASAFAQESGTARPRHHKHRGHKLKIGAASIESANGTSSSPTPSPTNPTLTNPSTPTPTNPSTSSSTNSSSGPTGYFAGNWSDSCHPSQFSLVSQGTGSNYDLKINGNNQAGWATESVVIGVNVLTTNSGDTLVGTLSSDHRTLTWTPSQCVWTKNGGPSAPGAGTQAPNATLAQMISACGARNSTGCRSCVLLDGCVWLRGPTVKGCYYKDDPFAAITDYDSSRHWTTLLCNPSFEFAELLSEAAFLETTHQVGVVPIPSRHQDQDQHKELQQQQTTRKAASSPRSRFKQTLHPF